jgi:general secretion pathway protein C
MEINLGVDFQEKRLVTAIVLFALALCAFFFAKGATGLAAASVFSTNTAAVFDATAKSGAAAQSLGTRMPDVKAILARNIFDSSTGPLWPPPDTGATAAAEEAVDQTPLDPRELPPPCEGSSLKLIAAVYSDKRPEWSFASLTAGSGPPLLYREGGRVDTWEVSDIYPRAVYLRPSSGKICSLLLFEDLKARAAAAKKKESVPEKTASPSSGDSLSDRDLTEGITAVSDTEFNVSRGLVDKLLLDQAALMRSARVVPHEVNGQVVGVKLYGVRRNSLLGKLGLQNGDLLRTINGYDMSRPDSALEAYSRLRNADNLTVSVQRRSQGLNVSYHIRYVLNGVYASKQFECVFDIFSKKDTVCE